MSGNHRTPPACAGGFNRDDGGGRQEEAVAPLTRGSERLRTKKPNTGA